MFSVTFRPNGAEIKLRKGACAKGRDMRSSHSCRPDLVEDQAAAGALDMDPRSLLPAEGSRSM
jgi:hypothetical protein